MSIFDCDPDWPSCLYDYTVKNLCPKYIAMRVQTPLNKLVIEDHFFSKDQAKQADELRSVHIANEERSEPPVVPPFRELVIERDRHICQDMQHPNFVPYFRKRFQAQDP